MILTTEILTWSNTLSFNFLKNHKFPRVFIKGIRLPLISLSTSSTSHSINHRLFGRPRLLCNVHFYSNVHYWVIESLSISRFFEFPASKFNSSDWFNLFNSCGIKFEKLNIWLLWFLIVLKRDNSGLLRSTGFRLLFIVQFLINCINKVFCRSKITHLNVNGYFGCQKSHFHHKITHFSWKWVIFLENGL